MSQIYVAKLDLTRKESKRSGLTSKKYNENLWLSKATQSKTDEN